MSIELSDLVTDIVFSLTQEKALFTAYDVTALVRTKDPSVKHYEVRDLVSQTLASIASYEYHVCDLQSLTNPLKTNAVRVFHPVDGDWDYDSDICDEYQLFENKDKLKKVDLDSDDSPKTDPPTNATQNCFPSFDVPGAMFVACSDCGTECADDNANCNGCDDGLIDDLNDVKSTLDVVYDMIENNKLFTIDDLCEKVWEKSPTSSKQNIAECLIDVLGGGVGNAKCYRNFLIKLDDSSDGFKYVYYNGDLLHHYAVKEAYLKQKKVNELPLRNRLLNLLFKNSYCKMELVKNQFAMTSSELKEFLESSQDLFKYLDENELSEDLLEYLVKHNNPEARAKAAQNPYLSPENLENLAKDSDYRVKHNAIVTAMKRGLYDLVEKHLDSSVTVTCREVANLLDYRKME